MHAVSPASKIMLQLSNSLLFTQKEQQSALAGLIESMMLFALNGFHVSVNFKPDHPQGKFSEWANPYPQARIKNKILLLGTKKSYQPFIYQEGGG